MLQEGISKDRLLFLRLTKSMEFFFASADECFTLGPMEPYQRKICHTVATYYSLDHFLDPSGQAVVFRKNASSHPDSRVRDLLGPDTPSTAPSRVIIARRSTTTPTSASAVSPSTDENGNPESGKGSESIEERQERYRQTRERIFGDFVPKPDEPALPPAPAPAAPAEPLMRFPEVPANRSQPQRSRQSPWGQQSPFAGDNGRFQGFSGPRAAAPAPLLQVGSGSHVWQGSAVYGSPAEALYRAPPLLAQDSRAFASQMQATAPSFVPQNQFGYGAAFGPFYGPNSPMFVQMPRREAGYMGQYDAMQAASAGYHQPGFAPQQYSHPVYAEHPQGPYGAHPWK